ncbi:MAG: hypothetical protein CSA75_05605, partial [Sorangium cellulosum]
MRKELIVASVLNVLGLAIAGVACSDSAESETPGESSGGGNSAAGSGIGGSGGTGNENYFTGGSGGVGDASSMVETGNGLPRGCATDSYAGELVPLDMHVMLDRSGSMNASDMDGDPSRWSSITSAISEFMNLPGAAGMGMAMAFFPVEPSVPVPKQCQVPEDCLPYSKKCFFNRCLKNIAIFDSCLVDDYRAPAVPMNLLPDVAADINNAMSSTVANGSTPMAPALSGAIEYAADWLVGQPDHVAIVVLATDGYPTHCVPDSIESVADVAAGGFNDLGIKTFVIGIGTHLSNLNMIAQHGGTDAAIMVD